MVDTRDILLKAAEDVQQGMWCRGGWFRNIHSGTYLMRMPDMWGSRQTLDYLTRHQRCAGGSLALATANAGGDYKSWVDTLSAVGATIRQTCDCAGHLQGHNDHCLSDDPFEAGQQLAELFRTTAESL